MNLAIVDGLHRKISMKTVVDNLAFGRLTDAEELAFYAEEDRMKANGSHPHQQMQSIVGDVTLTQRAITGVRDRP